MIRRPEVLGVLVVGLAIGVVALLFQFGILHRSTPRCDALLGNHAGCCGCCPGPPTQYTPAVADAPS